MRRFTFLHIVLFACMLAGVIGLAVWLYQRLQPSQGVTYYFYVPDSSGLPEGTEVKFHGLPVGQVVHVTLDEKQSMDLHEPAFRVDFQINPQGQRVFGLWSFENVMLGKETPLIGATVVTLVRERMPGGRTPSKGPLNLLPQADGLSDELNAIVQRAGQAVDDARAALRNVRASLGARPDRLGDDRAANLQFALQRDVYPLDYGESDGVGRPTRVGNVLGDLALAARSFAAAGDNITAVTRNQGPVDNAMINVSKLMSDLDDPNQTFLSTMAEFKKTAAGVTVDFAKYGKLADRLSPGLDKIVNDAGQMTDTLKREPWRIIWKSTKEYGPAASPTPARVANDSRGARAAAAPTPTPKKGGH